MTTADKAADFDPEHHITSSELAHIRGPYVRRPTEQASGPDWMRWAEEVARAYPDAKLLLEAQAAKTAKTSQRQRRTSG